MKIIINQNKLQSAVRAAERVVAKNISLPILNTILLKVEGSKVVCTATNLEIGIHHWLGAKVEEPGVLAIPAKIFSDFISTVQDEVITLTSEKNNLLIASERYQTKILCMGPEEFPIIPTLRNKSEFTLSNEQLKTAIAGVLDATSLLETRPELTGVYTRVTAKDVTFAATDSFRLSEYIVKTNTGADTSFIIPRTTALEMMRLAAEHQEPMKIAVSENQISMRGESFELVSRLIDGRYPEYKKVIPDKFTAKITINKQELDRTVRMAGIFSSSISDLLLKVSNGTLQLIAKNSDRGEIAASVPATGVKSPFDASVNYRYLLDGLKVLPTENIVIGYSGQGSPLTLQGEGNDNQVYVIMPLRT